MRRGCGCIEALIFLSVAGFLSYSGKRLGLQAFGAAAFLTSTGLAVRFDRVQPFNAHIRHGSNVIFLRQTYGQP